ncbi:MAG: glycosyl transferase family 1 [Sphingobacterium sp.]|jgi:glycosyltransferase involved in cell wall biosynthesis|uniref:glycosyltransferase family 4 protein n=1 Tax=Sphingobacterium sp. CZ-UAM TaxID=1933868 RepID=UPI000986E0B7|nr:glycosyltransferase family 4 protein [Sphingobacterium sp. CZ-UAM]MDF2518053.1 glycosyl transferase family 1 [Sphingobacterium sp.]OOG20121.1 glycosyl transferase family 1 [Sphingobacterium sp. CZ-UAM]
MRIVILGSAYPLRGGGIASFNERLAAHFQELGHEVDIYSFTLQYPNFLFPGKSQYSDEPAPTGLNIKTKVNSINPLNWLRVGRELRNARYDLLIVRFWMPFFGPCLGTIQRQVRKNKHTKIVCIADNIIPHEQRFGDKLLIRYFLKSVDACVTMSKSVLAELKMLSPQMPAVYTPHPLYDNYGAHLSKPEARKLLHIDQKDKVILFFGFIRQYKGLDMLLEALADARLRDLNIKLLLAGEFYGDPAPYFALIKKYHLEESIYMHTDFIPNQEVGRYFSAADCVVLPYRSATQSGITQVAYHFDLPMIVSNVGGLPELVQDGYVGYVVGPDVDSIATGIASFYHHDKEKQFRTNIIDEKKKYSWDTFCNELLKLID